MGGAGRGASPIVRSSPHQPPPGGQPCSLEPVVAAGLGPVLQGASSSGGQPCLGPALFPKQRKKMGGGMCHHVRLEHHRPRPLTFLEVKQDWW